MWDLNHKLISVTSKKQIHRKTGGDQWGRGKERDKIRVGD